MSGDKQLIDAYKHKRDLYATMAAKIHGNDYWDNMETYEDGTPNPEGKKRRGAVKTLVLAILYGMGADSLAVDLNIKKEEAQKLIDDFYKGYPTVKDFIDRSKKFAHQYGYVQGILGRRRRLPEVNLPKYTITHNSATSLFNPLLFTDNVSSKREDEIVKKYRDALDKSKNWKDSKDIIESAKKDNVSIVSNGGYIARAERQCVNSIIQGGAATITKMAMINAYNDMELRSLGFRMLICVHDEIIGECPTENSERVAKRLEEVMIGSAAKVCSVPMKVDSYQTKRWYSDDFFNYIHAMYLKDIDGGVPKEQEIADIERKFRMINKDILLSMCNGNFDVKNCANI